MWDCLGVSSHCLCLYMKMSVVYEALCVLFVCMAVNLCLSGSKFPVFLEGSVGHCEEVMEVRRRVMF